MFKNICFGIGLTLTFAVAAPMTGFAQSTDAADLTAEELQERFNKQKTRGLVLAPTGAEETATAATATAEVEETVEPDGTYVELAPEDQVSIQISFDFDSAALRDDQKPRLTTLCTVMQNVDVETFRIVGHTDTSGSAGYNERLSLLRAQEVKRYLVNDCGIPDQRLEAVGVGEQFPIDKDNPGGDANRRVEFQALS